MSNKKDTNIIFRKPTFWVRVGHFFVGNKKYQYGEYSCVDFAQKDEPLEKIFQAIPTVISVILVVIALLFTYGFVSAATDNRITRFDGAVAGNFMNNVLDKEADKPASELTLVSGGVKELDVTKSDFKEINKDRPVTKLY